MNNIHNKNKEKELFKKAAEHGELYLNDGNQFGDMRERFWEEYNNLYNLCIRTKGLNK